MKKRNIILGIVMGLFLISFVSATVTCNPNFVYEEYEQGTETTKTIQCTNDANNSVSITKSGDFTISDSIIGASPSQKTITITFNPSSPVGINQGKIQFGGTDDVNIVFNVKENSAPQGCVIDVFPSVLQNIKIEQGENKIRNIQLSVPLCYDTPVTVSGISLQSDQKPIQLGEISIGKIEPGNSVILPLELNAVDVSTGNYNDVLQFLLYDSLGNKINLNSVSISVIVTQGINPITNFSLSELPVCSLNSVDLATNNSYKLTCSRTNPNIDIEPIINYDYIEGIKVEETSSQYIYTFIPRIIGETLVGAKFKYKNAEIGIPFLQPVRISPSGNTPIGGIQTRLAFYQDGINTKIDKLNAGETLIQILDNSTGNILNNYNIYLNGLLTNNTITVESGKNYELRVSVPAYLDNVINFNVTNTPLTLTITPNKDFYIVGEKINITSNQNSTSYLLDNVIITSPYTFLTAGEKVLEVKKQGYETTSKNISVKNSVFLSSCSPDDWDKWKVGKKIVCDLNLNDSKWSVFHNEISVVNGTGKRIEFKINEEGSWRIEADGMDLYSKNFEKGDLNFWKFWTWRWYSGWITLVVIILIVVYYKYFKEEDDELLTPLSDGGE